MLDLQQTPEMKSLLVSVLSLGRAQDVLKLMTDLPRWLSEFAQDAGVLVHIVVRNNDPNVSFDEVRLRFAKCERDYPVLRCTLVTGQPNTGFGGAGTLASAEVVEIRSDARCGVAVSAGVVIGPVG